MDQYEIRIKGHIDKHWQYWFEGMNIDLHPGGETIITGDVKDQSSLHGMLNRIRDMGIVLVSVKRTTSTR